MTRITLTVRLSIPVIIILLIEIHYHREKIIFSADPPLLLRRFYSVLLQQRSGKTQVGLPFTSVFGPIGLQLSVALLPSKKLGVEKGIDLINLPKQTGTMIYNMIYHDGKIGVILWDTPQFQTKPVVIHRAGLVI